MEKANDNGIKDSASPETTKHAGSCHCGAVRFEVWLDRNVTGSRCNCSVCTKTAMTGTAVKPGAFVLLAGEEGLGAYEWGAKLSRRFFCRTCGVQCFARGHLAELGGDYVSISLNALDDLDAAELKMIYWDGRHNNWHAGPRPTAWPRFGEGAKSPEARSGR